MAKQSGGTRQGGGVVGPQFKGTENRTRQMEHRDDLDPSNKYDRINYIMEQTGVDFNTARVMEDAISEWEGVSYDIRQYQKGNGGDDETKRRAEAIDKFIEKSPKWAGGPTYRGVKDSGERYSSLGVGDTYTENASSSWTTEEIKARGFSSFYRTIIVCKAPQNGTSISHLAPVYGGPDGEREVVTHSKNQYEVTGKEKKGNYTYIYVKPK